MGYLTLLEVPNFQEGDCYISRYPKLFYPIYRNFSPLIPS